MYETPLMAENRKALDRQILDNHFISLIHHFRQLDVGLCPADWQQWYVDILEGLVAAFDHMPDLYRACGLDHEIRVDNSDLIRAAERLQAQQEARERARARASRASLQWR